MYRQAVGGPAKETMVVVVALVHENESLCEFLPL